MLTCFRYLLLLALLGGSAFSLAQSTGKVKIVTSIKPLSLIAADIGGDLVEIEQLIPANSSPHNFAMRVSDRLKIGNADLVLWVGNSLDPFVGKMISAQQIGVAADTLTGISWPATEEGSHDHEHDHGHEDEHHDGCVHHGGGDPHIWLNPENAAVIAAELAVRLGEIDPDNREHYQRVSARFEVQLHEFDKRARQQLSSLPAGQFVVLHDAYGHFVNRFQLQQLGSLRSLSGAKVGARSLAELLEHGEGGLACVISDPQFDVKPALTFAERTGVTVIELDPLGSQVELGESGYRRFLQGFVDTFVECLQR